MLMKSSRLFLLISLLFVGVLLSCTDDSKDVEQDEAALLKPKLAGEYSNWLEESLFLPEGWNVYVENGDCVSGAIYAACCTFKANMNYYAVKQRVDYLLGDPVYRDGEKLGYELSGSTFHSLLRHFFGEVRMYPYNRNILLTLEEYGETVGVGFVRNGKTAHAYMILGMCHRDRYQTDNPCLNCYDPVTQEYVHIRFSKFSHAFFVRSPKF